LVAITAICFLSMLRNDFANWDDEFYVQKSIAQWPSWAGIFGRPVVSKFHPLTKISLVINLALSGTDPSSY